MMFTTLKRFFDFCNKEDRKKLYLAIGLGTVKAVFAAVNWIAVPAYLCFFGRDHHAA
jgi:ATP-binding cassette subfamily B protein